MGPTELQPVTAEPRTFTDPGVAAAVQPPARIEGPGAQRPSADQGGRREERNPDARTLRALSAEVQSLLDDLDIRLSFRFAEKPRELVLQVVDRESGEIIRQVPPEDVLKLREKLAELRGVLFSGSV